jgi:hypothetical protein
MNGEVVGCEIGGVSVDIVPEATYRQVIVKRSSYYDDRQDEVKGKLTLDRRYGQSLPPPPSVYVSLKPSHSTQPVLQTVLPHSPVSRRPGPA